MGGGGRGGGGFGRTPPPLPLPGKVRSVAYSRIIWPALNISCENVTREMIGFKRHLPKYGDTSGHRNEAPQILASVKRYVLRVHCRTYDNVTV